RRDLHLGDAEGTDCLPTATIFEELARMGAKSIAWNEFSSSMASLIICLATNQKFNLSKYIFDAMVKHLDGGVKFCRIPIITSLHIIQHESKKKREEEIKMSTENGVNSPAPNLAHNSNFSLLSVLGRERLTGPNNMDWMQNLRFTPRYENKEYVLNEKVPTIDDDLTQEEIEAHRKHYDDTNKVSCIIASSMSPEL
ncbi:hypothetical protein Tco_0781577, partial [Tanacetum coccineum]